MADLNCLMSASTDDKPDSLQDLQARRTAALAAMRASARDLKAFAEAAKVEAELAFQIRRLKSGSTEARS